MRNWGGVTQCSISDVEMDTELSLPGERRINDAHAHKQGGNMEPHNKVSLTQAVCFARMRSKLNN